MKARLLDMGMVSALRSQSIYHAVTDCMTPDSDIAISLMRPRSPYVSIGFFQEAEREVDLELCARRRLPVLRRAVGGGAVLLDRNQLFFHVMVPRAKAKEFGLPGPLESRFAFLAKPAIEAYRALHVAAEFRPVNDIHVNGRKIGGTGVGELGDGLVFAGSMMLDFDTATMAQVLRIPDEKMRDKVAQSLDDYMTTLRKELGKAPPLETVAEALITAFEAAYGLDLVPSMPTPEELEAMEQWDATLSDNSWLHAVRLEEAAGRDVKIAAHVHVLHAQHKAQGGMIKATARVVQDRIDELLLAGDFPVTPNSALQDLAVRLKGLPAERGALATCVDEAFRGGSFEMAGVGAADFDSLFQQLIR